MAVADEILVVSSLANGLVGEGGSPYWTASEWSGPDNGCSSQGGWDMKRGRATARARCQALTVALALAVASAAIASVAPGPASVAWAQGRKGVITHSTKGVLLRAEPDYAAEVVTTVAEGTAVGLRTDVTDTVYDPDGVTQWWPVSAGDTDGWVAGFYLDIAG